MRKLLKGNEAIVLGSLVGGSDAFFGYPIAPGGEIVEFASLYYLPLGKIFIQAESEIAAIYMVYGAAASGLRVLSSGSGPGIRLMQEGISSSVCAELPFVLIDVMRAGPGAGNNGAEQSDYDLVVQGGRSGSCRTIVLTPNSVSEIYQMSIRAFELADQYRIPVQILIDADLAQMMEPVEVEEISLEKGEKNWKLDPTRETNGNLVTTAWRDFDAMENHFHHLEEKYREIEEKETESELYRMEDAEIVLSGYGIVSRILRSAVDQLREQGIHAGLIRPKRVSPFPKKDFQSIFQQRGKDLPFLVVELSAGQYVEDVKRAIPGAHVFFYGRQGGNKPTADEIMEQVQKIIKTLNSQNSVKDQG